MPKLKTKSSAKKRFRFTASGKIKIDMKDISKVELHPKFDGKQMIMVIQPL